MKPEDIEREVKEITQDIDDLIKIQSSDLHVISTLLAGYFKSKGPLFTMWVKASERMPCIKDADDSADVVSFNGNSLRYENYNLVDDEDLWLPAPLVAISEFDKWFAAQQFEVDDQTKEVMRKAFEAGKTQE